VVTDGNHGMGERRRRPLDDGRRGPGALLKSCRATQTQDERRPARITAPIDAYDASSTESIPRSAALYTSFRRNTRSC
jgi:hypothetical protein